MSQAPPRAPPVVPAPDESCGSSLFVYTIFHSRTSCMLVVATDALKNYDSAVKHADCPTRRFMPLAGSAARPMLRNRLSTA